MAKYEEGLRKTAEDALRPTGSRGWHSTASKGRISEGRRGQRAYEDKRGRRRTEGGRGLTFHISAVVGPGRADAVLADAADLRDVGLGAPVAPVETVLGERPLRTG